MSQYCHDFRESLPGEKKKSVRGFQGGDVAEKGFGGRVCLCVGEITVDGCEIGFRGNQAGSEERFHFRGKKESAAAPKVVEGLFAKAVAGGEEVLVLRIPDGESEHAIQEVETLGSLSSVGSEEYLSIGVGAEWVGLEFVAQLHPIENFAVETDGQVAGVVAHGLMAARGAVENGQAATAEHHAI